MHTAVKRQEIQPLRKTRFEVRVWEKVYTQAIIRRLKNEGYTVEKEHGMYKGRMPDGEKELVFQAAPGMRGYLIRFHPDLLQVA